MTGEATNTLGIYPSLGPDGVMQPPSASAAFVPLSSKSFAKIPGKTLQMQSRGIAEGALQNHGSHLVGNCNKTYQSQSF